MTPLTVLHKTIRVRKYNRNLAIALVKHDLLLDDETKRKQLRVPEKSKNNVYKLRNQVIKNQEDRQNALLIIDSLFKNDNDKINLKAFRKLKHKMKSWSQNPLNVEQECILYSKVLSHIEIKKSLTINEEAILKYFDKLNSVKRSADKKRALTAIIRLHNMRTTLNVDHTSQLNTCIVSVIFKIPGGNEHSLSAEQQEQLVVNYYQKYFPQFPILISVIHKDETIPHVHLTIDAKNSVTGQHDFVQKQYELVKELTPSIANYESNYSDLGQDKKQKNARLTHVGELLQSHFYEYLNAEQKKYVFEKKQYESPELKAIERKIIALDTNKPIAEREYNTANYLKKIKNKVSNDLGILKAETEKLINIKQRIVLDIGEKQDRLQGLRKQEQTIKSEVKNTKSALSTYEDELMGLVHLTIMSAYNFASSYDESAIQPFKNSLNKVFQNTPQIADTILNIAKDVQPNKDKRQKIKHVGTLMKDANKLQRK
jgi:hypothetical protein